MEARKINYNCPKCNDLMLDTGDRTVRVAQDPTKWRGEMNMRYIRCRNCEYQEKRPI